MQHIAVVGAGLIGASWAIVFARAGRQVALFDSAADCRAELPTRLHDMLTHSAALLPADTTIDAVMARIQIVADLTQAVSQADYVQEAVSENLALKRKVFAELDALAPGHAILASSTSTYGASGFTANLRGRDRCLVAHPATPPHVLPVVELAPAAWTRPTVLAEVEAFMRAIGQHPVRIHKEIPGFVLNRLQGALLMEMFRVIAEGVITPGDADALIAQGLGLRWAALGPLAGIDLNAPDGIADYLHRYGHIFNDMAREAGMPAPVNDALIAALAQAQRATLPLEQLPARRNWRDQAIGQVRHAVAAALAASPVRPATP